MPAISVLMKPSSSLCNMSCDYCFYCDEAQKRTHKSYGFMTEETLKNVIRKTLLRAEGYISYAYQGGEPTLRVWISTSRLSPFKSNITKTTLPYQIRSKPMAICQIKNGANSFTKIIFQQDFLLMAPEKSTISTDVQQITRILLTGLLPQPS